MWAQAHPGCQPYRYATGYHKGGPEWDNYEQTQIIILGCCYTIWLFILCIVIKYRASTSGKELGELGCFPVC